jgi:hypothetical protein
MPPNIKKKKKKKISKLLYVEIKKEAKTSHACEHLTKFVIEILIIL